MVLALKPPSAARFAGRSCKSSEGIAWLARRSRSVLACASSGMMSALEDVVSGDDRAYLAALIDPDAIYHPGPSRPTSGRPAESP